MSILLLVLLATLARAQPQVVAVNVDSPIHPITADIVSHALVQAKQQHAAAVLIRLNTPGGLLDVSREISSMIVTSTVPVVGYVTPRGGRAASAGFFLLESADVAAMSPGTNTGAASPVLMTGPMDSVMRSKVESDVSAWLRGIVIRRNRNAEAATTTVHDARSFTDKEARETGLIDLVSGSETQLLDTLDGMDVRRLDGETERLRTRGAIVVNYRLSLRERLIQAIADPNIGYVLLVFGALGIYIETQVPGIILPGVAGGILLLLGLSSLAMLPINWAGIALLLLAVACFVLEAKVSSHGVLGIGGTLAMVLGAVLLINGPPLLTIRLSTAIAVAGPFALIMALLVTLVVRSRSYQVAFGEQALINSVAEAKTALGPEGTVFINGEYWNAISNSDVQSGAAVRIVSIDGITLRVEPVSPTPVPGEGSGLA